MVKYSIILIPNAFMWWIVDSSDRIMISSMVGYAENGLYAIANKFPALLYTVAGIFNQAWSYSAIKEEESTDKDSYSNNVYDKLVSFVVLAAAGLMVIIKPLLSIYVGSDFYHAWIFTPFLIIGVVFMSLGTFASSAYTVHRDSVGFLKSASVGAGVNLALNFLLIPLLGVQGAAIATCISYVFVYLFRVFDTRKYTKLKILRIDHLVGYVFLLIMAGTMLVNSPYSQGFLVMEMMLLVVCYKKYIMQYIEFIKSNLIKR